MAGKLEYPLMYYMRKFSYIHATKYMHSRQTDV